ncbi:MAG: M20/M25/M40 family metallo-hydrolase [Phycisphaerales bacterium]|nr:M20/M25/M40 family metallo-hydrolase [Phycisphaerales bacterium]
MASILPRLNSPARRYAALSSLALLAACGCSRSTHNSPAAGAETTAEAFVSGKPAAPVAIINGEPAPVPDIPMGDPATIRRILAEGKNRNHVMQHLTYICTKIGPRLTGSSAAEQANHWTADQFRSWGLTNVDLFRWGEIPLRFDRGPSTGKLVTKRERRGEGEQAQPEYQTLRDLEITTLAWTGGTSGPVRGPVVRIPETDDEFEKVKDQLRGAWVLLKGTPVTGRAGLRVVGASMSDRALARYAIQTGKPLTELGVSTEDEERTANMEDLVKEQRRLIEAGVAGFISSSRDERVWTGAFRRWRELDPACPPRDVEVSVRLSDYDYMNSRLADGEKIEAEFDLKNTFTAGPIPVYDTVAEIPGTDRPDEYVIVSAHLDSWNGPGSMGTTDNGTGSSVTLEAARLLMAAGAKPRRTIKFILWTGEEQGLLGSREWVKQHEALWPKISACFVDDGGTNYEGGLKCTDAMAPMLAAATAPVNNQFFDSKDGKPLNVNIQPGGERFNQSGGSDHASFIAKGIPGFFWDEVGRAEYGYGWHTQHDKLDLAIPEYLQQSSTCAAITAYNLACAPDLLPRFPMDQDGGGDDRPRRRRREQ